MAIDYYNMTAEELDAHMEQLKKAKEKQQKAHLYAFLDGVEQLAIEKGVSWGKAKELVNDYQPKDDQTAKALGFKCCHKESGKYLLLEYKDKKKYRKLT